LKSDDWTIIPLENVVARDVKVVLPVSSKDDGAVALVILEKGVRGILIRTDDPAVVKEIAAFMKRMVSQMVLSEFTIKDVRKVFHGRSGLHRYDHRYEIG
jgi:3-dehydroquinate synthase II